MDEARAAAKRRRIYPKMQRAYAKALRQSSGEFILMRLRATSDTEEIASLIAKTGEVGREMCRVDAKKKWPADLDVGSVHGRWQGGWGKAAVFAIGRAFDSRDGTTTPDNEWYRFMSSRWEDFGGEEPNFGFFLSKAEPERVTSFFQQVLETPR